MTFQGLEDELPLLDHAAKYFAAPAPHRDPLGSHRADATVLAGLNASTGDGKGGENSTGVRAYNFIFPYPGDIVAPALREFRESRKKRLEPCPKAVTFMKSS